MEDQTVGTTFSLVRYNNPIVIDKEESLVRPKSAPASTGTSEAQDETQEILDSILPPREWEEDGKLWRQSVSSTPATRLDVMNLQEQLDLKLQQRQARETGICQVRTVSRLSELSHSPLSSPLSGQAGAVRPVL